MSTDEKDARTLAQPPGAAPDAARERAVRSIESAALMHGARELVIVHGPDRYRLRITANDKLILTK